MQHATRSSPVEDLALEWQLEHPKVHSILNTQEILMYMSQHRIIPSPLTDLLSWKHWTVFQLFNHQDSVFRISSFCNRQWQPWETIGIRVLFAGLVLHCVLISSQDECPPLDSWKGYGRNLLLLTKQGQKGFVISHNGEPPPNRYLWNFFRLKITAAPSLST